MARFNRPRDPYWTTARRAAPDNPESMGGAIKQGDRIFYYPNSGAAYVGAAAEIAARDFEAARQDEAGYGY